MTSSTRKRDRSAVVSTSEPPRSLKQSKREEFTSCTFELVDEDAVRACFHRTPRKGLFIRVSILPVGSESRQTYDIRVCPRYSNYSKSEYVNVSEVYVGQTLSARLRNGRTLTDLTEQDCAEIVRICGDEPFTTDNASTTASNTIVDRKSNDGEDIDAGEASASESTASKQDWKKDCIRLVRPKEYKTLHVFLKDPPYVGVEFGGAFSVDFPAPVVEWKVELVKLDKKGGVHMEMASSLSVRDNMSSTSTSSSSPSTPTFAARSASASSTTMITDAASSGVSSVGFVRPNSPPVSRPAFIGIGGGGADRNGGKSLMASFSKGQLTQGMSQPMRTTSVFTVNPSSASNQHSANMLSQGMLQPMMMASSVSQTANTMFKQTPQPIQIPVISRPMGHMPWLVQQNHQVVQLMQHQQQQGTNSPQQSFQLQHQKQQQPMHHDGGANNMSPFGNNLASSPTTPFNFGVSASTQSVVSDSFSSSHQLPYPVMPFAQGQFIQASSANSTQQGVFHHGVFGVPNAATAVVHATSAPSMAMSIPVQHTKASPMSSALFASTLAQMTSGSFSPTQ